LCAVEHFHWLALCLIGFVLEIAGRAHSSMDTFLQL
jgi:hypothetical protein